MDFTENYLYALVVKLAKDKVSNLRMLSGPVLKKMIKIAKKKDIITECKAALEDLKKDKDQDVVTFATTDV